MLAYIAELFWNTFPFKKSEPRETILMCFLTFFFSPNGHAPPPTILCFILASNDSGCFMRVQTRCDQAKFPL